MSADHSRHPVVHLVGSIPLPDAETVFRTVSGAVGPHLTRLPDGETGIRKTWIRFLQDVLADNPAIELASDVPPFKFVQWDGKVVREIPRLRVKPGATPDASVVQDRLRRHGDRVVGPVRPVAAGRRDSAQGEIPDLHPDADRTDLQQHGPVRPAQAPAGADGAFAGEVAKIAQALPNDRIALQWDVCQEVLAWEGYYEPGPVDVRIETIDVLAKVGDAVPAAIELGYHLCYGSPADEHMVQPKDAGIMVEIANAVVAKVARPIQFFHMPVPKGRSDDAYFAPLEKLQLGAETELYLGLIHHDDAQGDAARLAAARRHVRVDGIGTECGMARGDPARLPALLAAHARAAKLPA